MLSLLIAAQILALAPESKIWIDGDSNLHPWSCAATRHQSKLELDDQTPRTLELLIEVDGLECGNGKMNEKLREALRSAKHPYIEFTLTQSQRADAGLRVSGELTIAGKTRPVQFTVDVDGGEVAGDEGFETVSGWE
jgi:polyisoprenoid-binding protein YceI